MRPPPAATSSAATRRPAGRGVQSAMPISHLRLSLGAGLASGLLLAAAAPGAARAQNASLTVYMRAAGSGTLNQTSSTATQVHVSATSGLAAKYNGATNLYAPSGKVASGGSFSLDVTNLYSPAAAPGNTYLIELAYTDNADKKLTFGPLTLAPGVNKLGSGGLGTTTPIDVTNDPPPAAKNLNCYADLPDRSTQLYLYWSGPLMATVKDYAKTELHMAKTAGFTPSAATLIATPPYGTDYRKVTGLTPLTDYYYCVRVYDDYGAFTDACRAAACSTQTASATTDGGSGTTDGGSGTTDGGSGTDAGSGSTDGGGDGIPDGGGDGTPDASQGGGGEDAGIDAGSQDGGSIPVGCGCSLAQAAPTPGLLLLGPAVLVLLRAGRRRRTR